MRKTEINKEKDTETQTDRGRWGITDPLTLNAFTSYVKACKETISRV